MLRRSFAWLLGEYELYRVYALDLERLGAQLEHCEEGLDLVVLKDGTLLEHHSDEALAALRQYAGNEARGFALTVKGDVAAACWYWYGDRYRARNFWPLKPQEAKLVQVVTGVAHRNKGLATRLISASARHLAADGFRTVFARIWHSNRPSIRAFEKVGFRYVAFVATCRPVPFRRRLRFVRRRRV